MEAMVGRAGAGVGDGTGHGRRGRRRRVIVATVATAFLGVSVLVPAAVASAAGRQGAPEVALAGRGSKLSGRLQKVLQPQVRALAGASQSHAVGLADTGAGSLMQRSGGRVVVRIRFHDTSSATLDAVGRAGVSDLSLSAPDAVANGVIAPQDLPALAEVPGVASVQEEITPLVGRPSPPNPGRDRATGGHQRARRLPDRHRQRG